MHTLKDLEQPPLLVFCFYSDEFIHEIPALAKKKKKKEEEKSERIPTHSIR